MGPGRCITFDTLICAHTRLHHRPTGRGGADEAWSAPGPPARGEAPASAVAESVDQAQVWPAQPAAVGVGLGDRAGQSLLHLGSQLGAGAEVIAAGQVF